jgi:hypothetical protein
VNACMVPKIRPWPLPTKSFPIHHHSLITLSSTLDSLVTEKASYKLLTWVLSLTLCIWI